MKEEKDLSEEELKKVHYQKTQNLIYRTLAILVCFAALMVITPFRFKVHSGADVKEIFLYIYQNFVNLWISYGISCFIFGVLRIRAELVQTVVTFVAFMFIDLFIEFDYQMNLDTFSLLIASLMGVFAIADAVMFLWTNQITERKKDNPSFLKKFTIVKSVLLILVAALYAVWLMKTQYQLF